MNLYAKSFALTKPEFPTRVSRTLILWSTILWSTASSLAAGSAGTEADGSAPAVKDEVTVTAQRVEQELRDVPLSLAVFDGDVLERRGIADVQGLADATPGLVASGQSSSTGDAALYIRGIGSNTFGLGTESTVGFYIDGVYVPRPLGFLNQFLDLERVEVLRGPQGTLWGRNSTGGAVNLVTAAPTGHFKGRLFGQFGDFAAPGGADDQRLKFTLNGPLGEKVFARLAAGFSDVEDYTQNLATAGRAKNIDGWNARAGLNFVTSPSMSLTLRLDATDNESYNNFQLKPGRVSPISTIGTLARFFDLELPANVHQIAANIAAHTEYSEQGASLHLNKVLSGGKANLVSTSSFRTYDSTRGSDIDGTTLDFVENFGDFDEEWWSQEVQMAGGTGRLDWIGGLYFFHEEGTSNVDTRTDLALFEVAFFANNPGLFLFNPNDFCSLGFFAPTSVCGPAYYAGLAPFLGLRPIGNKSSGNFFTSVLDTDSIAAYGQLYWHLSDRWTLTGGLRYTDDDKSHQLTTIDFTTLAPSTSNASDSWQALTPKLGFEFRPREDLLLHGAVTTGFKSGGFNSISAQQPFNEETITSYEVGAKTRLAENRVTLDVSVFHYDYNDLQVAVLFPDRSTIENAAQASVNGLDLDLSWRPTSRFQVDLGLEWLDDEFDRFTTQDPFAVAAVQDSLNALGIFDPVTLAAAGALVPPSDLSGNGLPRAPDLATNLALQYSFPAGRGSVVARAEHQHVDDVAFDPFARLVQEGYELLHASLTWRPAGGRWSVNLYGRNLGDEEYLANEIFARVTGSLQVWGPPRQVGVQVGLEF